MCSNSSFGERPREARAPCSFAATGKSVTKEKHLNQLIRARTAWPKVFEIAIGLFGALVSVNESVCGRNAEESLRVVSMRQPRSRGA